MTGGVQPDFRQDPVTVARELLGWTLLVDGVGGVIVETEAYDADDPASHSFTGPTARNAAMFGPPGQSYVYLSYGLHWCLNIVCREAGHGAAVLIRALEPTAGIERMQARRRMGKLRLLAAGPGRVGQALGIDRAFDGLPLDRPPFELLPPAGEVQVAQGVRVGITKAADHPWRFAVAGSRYLSRPIS
ncbi:MAG: DNA-3-methyladenine glycosylase [Rubrivivax sp.]|nr:MAG: DNA-3-methyladenine glycosylase [Rubrivivax sp.]